MKNKETISKNTKNHSNKGMKDEFTRITEECNTVEIDGNKFDFSKISSKHGTIYCIAINSKESEYIKSYQEEEKEKQSSEEKKEERSYVHYLYPEFCQYTSSDPNQNQSSKYILSTNGLTANNGNGFYTDINLKNHIFHSFSGVTLNKDFSIRSITDIHVKSDKKNKEKSFEGIYMSYIYHPHIHSQNFYTFDKNKNITDVKKQITFELQQDDLLLDEEEPKDMLEDEIMKFNLLKMIKDIKINDDNNEQFYLTFVDNNAYVLIDDKLLFFEKDEKEYDLKGTINLNSENKKIEITGLTALDDKVFVKSENLDYKSNNTTEEIKIFERKTKQLKTAFSLGAEQEDSYGKSNFNCLNVIDFNKNCETIFDKNDYDKKLKEYFDKRAKITDNILKEDVKENLNKINDNKIQKRD